MRLILLNAKAPAFAACLEPRTGRYCRWRPLRPPYHYMSGQYSMIRSEFVAIYWDGEKLVFRWADKVFPVEESHYCRIERNGRRRTFYLYKGDECVLRKTYKLSWLRVLFVAIATRDPAWREMGWEEDNLLDHLEVTLGDSHSHEGMRTSWKKGTEERLRSMRKRKPPAT